MKNTLVQENYFVIASDMDLSKVENRLYGFAYCNNKLIHNSYMPGWEEEILSDDTIGAFTCIFRKEGEIEIISDHVGNGMIFYYCSSDFWAVSNSFYMLLLYLKPRVKLTVDEDYVALFITTNSICTSQHERTLVNEIKLLNVDKKIEVVKNVFHIVQAYDKEKKIKINTLQGIEIIDKWANKWIKVIRSLVNGNNRINLQLSGGFDSRVTLALFLAAGIDFEKINVESSTGMKEDYEIASLMAQHFDFQLNAKSPSWEAVKLNSAEILDMQLFNRLGVHQEWLAPVDKYYNEPLFTFTGLGSAHAWYEDSTDKYTQRMQMGMDSISGKKGIERILNETYNYIDSFFDYAYPRKRNFMNYAYMFTRNRYNVGSSMIHKASNNEFLFSPLQDPLYNLIDPIYENNDDFKMIAALLFTRLAPDLLNFPINENRSIKQETLVKAKEINLLKEFEIKQEDADCADVVYCSRGIITTTYRKEVFFKNNDILRNYLLENKKKYLLPHVSEKFFEDALDDLNTGRRHCERKAFSLLAVMEVVKACEESGANHMHFPSEKYSVGMKEE